MIEKFKGIGVALVTPFDTKAEVDYQALEKLVEHVVQGGVDYLVVLGTTGEAATCTPDEKQEILNKVISVNAGRKPIVFGIGGNNTAGVIDNFKTFDLSGVDAILSASPYYNKPSQEGIYQHYKAIAEQSELPIILYNVPGRTSSNVSAETTLRLAQLENVIAIKEASGNLEQCMTIQKQKPEDFILISGDDLLTTSMISFGASGVISVLANAFPSQFSGMINNALNGDFAAASKTLFNFLEINDLMYVESNPVGVKTALDHLGVIGSNVRLPLIKGSEDLRSQLLAHMKKNKFI